MKVQVKVCTAVTRGCHWEQGDLGPKSVALGESPDFSVSSLETKGITFVSVIMVNTKQYFNEGYLEKVFPRQRLFSTAPPPTRTHTL